jgi:hypothetical protein
MFVVISSANAEWNEDKINHITNEINKTGFQWSREQTEWHLRQAQNVGNYFVNFVTPEGSVSLRIEGETFLLNGKDMSGNLGSKTTHGNNSPIIENVQNSLITTGKNSPIDSRKELTNEVSGEIQVNIGDDNSIVNKTNNFNLTLKITLSIALSLSLLFNFYLVRKIKNKKGANKSLENRRA